MEFEISCFPLCYKNPQRPHPLEADFPDEVKTLLNDHFQARIIPRVPLHIAVNCGVNSELHGINAVYNTGRLPDEDHELTDFVREQLAERPPPDMGFYFLHWNNTYVERAQLRADGHRLYVASKCGLMDVHDFMCDCNGDYGTNFKNPREYAAAPYPAMFSR